jgi:hypothetical protein
MARKVVSRKAKRVEADAAEKKSSATSKTAKAAKAAPKEKKAPAKRKSRSKSAKDIRLKAFWGVFNQTLKRVALFEYSERKKADKMAADLTANGKSPHFVQLVKDVVQE